MKKQSIVIMLLVLATSVLQADRSSRALLQEEKRINCLRAAEQRLGRGSESVEKESAVDSVLVSCPICLDDVQVESDEGVVYLVCNSNNAEDLHVYHYDCLVAWRNTEKKHHKEHDPCPVCNQQYQAIGVAADDALWQETTIVERQVGHVPVRRRRRPNNVRRAGIELIDQIINNGNHPHDNIDPLAAAVSRVTDNFFRTLSGFVGNILGI